jgi:hypothetical protein
MSAAATTDRNTLSHERIPAWCGFRLLRTASDSHDPRPLFSITGHGVEFTRSLARCRRRSPRRRSTSWRGESTPMARRHRRRAVIWARNTDPKAGHRHPALAPAAVIAGQCIRCSAIIGTPRERICRRRGRYLGCAQQRRGNEEKRNRLETHWCLRSSNEVIRPNLHGRSLVIVCCRHGLHPPSGLMNVTVGPVSLLSATEIAP